MTSAKARNLRISMKFVDGVWEIASGGQVPVKDQNGGRATRAGRVHHKLQLPKSDVAAGCDPDPTERHATPRLLLSPKDRSDIPGDVTKHLLPIADLRRQIGLLDFPRAVRV